MRNTMSSVESPPPQHQQQTLELAVEHHGAGRLSQAENLYQRILQTDPDHPVALHLLGVIALQSGKSEQAIDLITRALSLKPDYAYAHDNLGNVFHGQERFEEALSCYRTALSFKPDYAQGHYNLGIALQDAGKFDEALASHRRAIALDPGNGLFWSGLAAFIELHSFSSMDDDLRNDLLRLLEQPSVRPSRLVRPIFSALRLDPVFSRILGLTDADMQAYGEIAVELSAIPLLLRIMGLCAIPDLAVERMLTRLRHAMLRDSMADKADEKALPFSTALALHCYRNEYVFAETSEEKAAIEAFQHRIEMLVARKRDVPPSLIAALGAYRPLDSFSWAGDLCDRNWAGVISLVVEQQISEPLKERSLRPHIQRLTPIQDTVSKLVREQYEQNPYPRWFSTDRKDNGKLIGSVLQETPLRFDLGEYVSPENPDILVAGCGTGQHALHTASRFSNARLLAIDLSLSSLSYAARKTEELEVINIEYAQADIMQLGGIGRRFDLIESEGVLHHLGDPLAGWRVLVDLLRPGGLMKIGLYSETARQHVIAGRGLIAEKGYGTSHEQIRRCRQDIIDQVENGNREMAKLCRTIDFFSLSECRDHFWEEGILF